LLIAKGLFLSPCSSRASTATPKTLKRLLFEGYVQSREEPARKDQGKKVVFYIPDEDTTQLQIDAL
jgi:hypothetical protein